MLVFTIQQLMSVLIIQQPIIVKQLFVIDALVLNLFIQQLILFFIQQLKLLFIQQLILVFMTSSRVIFNLTL